MPIRWHEEAREELREDLDFSIPTAPDTTRGDRSRAIIPVKAIVETLPNRVPGFDLFDVDRAFGIVRGVAEELG